MVDITLYGGVDEIGGNKILLESDGHRIFLDFGMSFGKTGEFFAQFVKPRTRAAVADLIRVGALPKLDGIYRQDACALDGTDALVAAHGFDDLWRAPVQSYDDYAREEGRPFVDAVVLSHAHMDHFGHFSYLDEKIPIYGAPVTLAALRAVDDVVRGGMENEFVHGKTAAVTAIKSGRYAGGSTIRGKDAWTRPLYELPLESRVTIPGTPFEITTIPVDHSVPGATSILVRVEGKTIYYSGDVRFHGIFKDETRRLRETVDGLAPDLFLCEGTRITEEASDSEDDVRTSLDAAFKPATGLAMVDFAWKDTSRFVTLQHVATSTRRTLVISHKLAYMLRKLHEAAPARHAPAEAFENVRVYKRRSKSLRYEESDYGPLALGYWAGTAKDTPDGDPLTRTHWVNGVSALNIRRDPSAFILMLSQFEMPDLIDLAPPKGSVFVRAACEPFSDEMDLDLQRQANWLTTFDVPVNADRDGGKPPIPTSLHASGHASGPDLRKFVRLVDAKEVVPIHTLHGDAFDQSGTRIRRANVGRTITL